MQLHELNAIRSRLAAVIQERARVTELLCQAISFDQGQQTPRESKRQGPVISLRRSPQILLPQPEGEELMGNPPLTRSSVLDSRPLTRSSVMDSRPLTRGSAIDSRPLTRGSMSSRQKAYSAPVPLELGQDPDAEPDVDGITALDLEPNLSAGEM